MAKVTKQMALDYHKYPRPGKIEVIPTKPYATQADLALAYSPGVAYPCLEIQETPEKAYDYTDKGNLVAVISNGTAVLGLGNIGALAGKPVMEGKALLFKIFAGLDCYDIEVDEKDPEKFISIVKALGPTFGGINLEDIKAPECFEIETRLKAEMDIPVMHDDQHGTAIISAAGLLNALEIQGKRIEDVRLVVNGAGAAAVSCTKLYIALGVRKENVVMCDSKGVISDKRTDLNSQKAFFATSRPITTLAEAMKDADVFLGLSVKDVVTPEMIKSMAPRPIVFALANPDPEIAYETATAARPDIIMATDKGAHPAMPFEHNFPSSNVWRQFTLTLFDTRLIHTVSVRIRSITAGCTRPLGSNSVESSAHTLSPNTAAALSIYMLNPGLSPGLAGS